MSDDLVKRLMMRLQEIYDRPHDFSNGQKSEAAGLARDRIEELEAKLAEAVGFLSYAIDMTGEPHCYHDHHGYCQAHNLEPRDECWVKKSQALIAELTGGKDE